MQSRCKLIFTFIALLAMSAPAHAYTIKCWHNKDGIRECGSTVPPEYSQSRIEVINERGLVVKVIEAAKTDEELARERERQRLEKEAEAIRKEQARQDQILLNAYTTERDLLIARDTNLKAAQGQIDILKGNLRLLQQNFNEYQLRAANFERTGEKPPQNIVDELTKTGKLIKDKELHIESKQIQKSEMEHKFERDLKRYRELKRGRVR